MKRADAAWILTGENESMSVKWWKHLTISAFWGPRAATAEEAAALIKSFGERLTRSEPVFGNLRGLRVSGEELLGRHLQRINRGDELTGDDTIQLFAQLGEHQFLLERISTAGLAAEMQLRVQPENFIGFGMGFDAQPGGAGCSVWVGAVHSASEPTANKAVVTIPLESPRAADTCFLHEVLAASIEVWNPRTCGVYGVWHDAERNFESHEAYWLHWRAPGIAKETWTDAKGAAVSRCWPEGAAGTSEPHLGGTLDIYPQYHPGRLAECAAAEIACF